MDEAETILDELVARLDATQEPNADLSSEIGCGDLEELIRSNGVRLWPRIERLARANVRFRRALRSVWAYDSPEFERRERLLEELGEFKRVSIRFVVEPDEFGDDSPLSWRAVEVEGGVPARRLAPILRSIADWAERE